MKTTTTTEYGDHKSFNERELFVGVTIKDDSAPTFRIAGGTGGSYMLLEGLDAAKYAHETLGKLIDMAEKGAPDVN